MGSRNNRTRDANDGYGGWVAHSDLVPIAMEALDVGWRLGHRLAYCGTAVPHWYSTKPDFRGLATKQRGMLGWLAGFLWRWKLFIAGPAPRAGDLYQSNIARHCGLLPS